MPKLEVTDIKVDKVKPDVKASEAKSVDGTVAQTEFRNDLQPYLKKTALSTSSSQAVRSQFTEEQRVVFLDPKKKRKKEIEEKFFGFGKKIILPDDVTSERLERIAELVEQSQSSGGFGSKASQDNLLREIAQTLEGQSQGADQVLGQTAPEQTRAAQQVDQTAVSAEQHDLERAQLEKEMQYLAISAANEHYDTGSFCEEGVRRAINNKLERLGISSRVEINRYLEEFEKTFESTVTEREENASWWEKTKRAAAGLVSGTVKLFKGAAVLGGWIKDGVTKLVTNPETWKTIGKGLLHAVNPVNWVKAGAWCAKKVAQGAVAVWKDPIGSVKAVWGGIKNVSESIGLTKALKGLGCLVKAPYQYVYDVARTGSFTEANANLVGNLKAGVDGIVGAGQVLCEVTGLTDAYMCVKFSGKACLAAAEGDTLGAAMYGAQAVMHGAFAAASAGSIAATVATGGAACGTMMAVATGRVAFKAGLKQVAKQALKTVGKEVAESAIKSVGKETLEKVGKEAAEGVIKEVAEKVGKEVAEKGLKEGAQVLSKETMQQTSRKVSQEVAERVLQKSGLGNAIKNSTKEAFEAIGKGIKGQGEIFEALVKNGMSPKQAQAACKNLSKAIRKSPQKTILGRGLAKQTEEELVEGLTKSVTGELTEIVYKESHEVFEAGIKKGLKGNPVLREALEVNAKKAGKTIAKETDELVEAAAKGYKEGLEKAIQKMARAGIKQALREFRRPRLHSSFGGGSGGVAGVALGDNIIGEVSGGLDNNPESLEPIEETKLATDQETREFESIKTRKGKDEDGNPAILTVQVLDDGSEIVLNCRTIVSAKVEGSDQELTTEEKRAQLYVVDEPDNVVPFSVEAKEKKKDVA